MVDGRLPGQVDPLSFRESFKLRTQLIRQRLREHLGFDSLPFRKLIGLGGVSASTLLRLAGKKNKALSIETAIHRGAYSSLADRLIESRLRKALESDRAIFARHVETLQAQPGTQLFFKEPERLIGKRILVLKSPGENEKGVIALDYFFVFPLFAKLFNVRAIAKRYHLVLEPSWAGYCDLDLLCYLAEDFPVFVQTYEPRDLAFLEALGANLKPVATAGNWWVDHRVFRPLPGAERDADVLLIAAWAKYKRHEALFAALARLRRQGERLRTILVGYQADCNSDTIYRLARFHGVADQLELYERLKPEQVNEQLNRVKVNVLWSRREGFNRAIIEGMFAGTPGIMREGFNYGYAYPYLNPRTGCFANERNLPERLLSVIRNAEQYSPREWVLENMTPQRATQVIDETIGLHARSAGERWTAGQLAVKVTQLDAMAYWDDKDRQRFEADHAFLRSMLCVKYD